MKDLLGAIQEEKSYVSDRMQGKKTNLTERLAQYGYHDLKEYFDEKKHYLFLKWAPEVYYIDEDFLDTQMENNIKNGVDGIYIITPKNEYYAFHGDDEINYDECKELGVRPIEMNYHGGTIIGSKGDLGILLIIPKDIMLSSTDIINKIMEIVRVNCPEATYNGNDILINGNKVMGSITKDAGDYYVWAAQFSFVEHDELISKICKKEQKKKPSTFYKLTRDKLEQGVLKWLL